MEDYAGGDSKARSKKIFTIVLWVAVAGVVGYLVYRQVAFGPKDEIKEMQATAEGGLKAYLTVAYNVSMGKAIGDLEKVVTEEDWRWFQDNHERLFREGDVFNVSGGIAPNEAVALSRMRVVQWLVEAGPTRPGDEILKREIGDAESKFTVRKNVDEYTAEAIEMTMVKEGKHWVLKGFCGARAALEGTGQVAAVPWNFPTDANGNVLPSGSGSGGSPTASAPAAVPGGIPGAGEDEDEEEGTSVAAAPDPLLPPPASPDPLAPAPASPGPSLAPAPAAAPVAAPPVQPAIPPPNPAPPSDPLVAGGAAPSDALLAPANALLNQARLDWEKGLLERAVLNARKALELYKKHLLPGDPRILQVRGIVNSAEQQAGMPPTP